MHRRAILAGSLGLPLLMRAALAAKRTNASLLLARFDLRSSPVHLDGEVTLACSLEARWEFCRVFVPLSWGYERGFKLVVAGPDGKTFEPKFHPPVPLPPLDAYKSGANFRELDVGENTGFRTKAKAKDIFPAPGSYTVHVVYVPEPLRAATTVGQAIVFENGPVETGSVRVKVV